MRSAEGDNVYVYIHMKGIYRSPAEHVVTVVTMGNGTVVAEEETTFGRTVQEHLEATREMYGSHDEPSGVDVLPYDSIWHGGDSQ